MKHQKTFSLILMILCLLNLFFLLFHFIEVEVEHMHLAKSIPVPTHNIMMTVIWVFGIQIFSIIDLVKQRNRQNIKKKSNPHLLFVSILIGILLTFFIPVKVNTTRIPHQGNTISTTYTLVTTTYYNLFSIPIAENEVVEPLISVY